MLERWRVASHAQHLCKKCWLADVIDHKRKSASGVANMIGDCHGVHSFAVSGGLALASTSDNGVRVVRDKDNEPEPASRILLARDGERNSRARRKSAPIDQLRACQSHPEWRK
jgi:hypothetical protein